MSRLVARFDALLRVVSETDTDTDLVADASTERHKTRENAEIALHQTSRCLANLLTLPGCREALLACGGLPRLVSATREGGCVATVGRLVAATRALSNFTFDATMAARAVQSGALEPLVVLLASDTLELQREAVWTVLNISAASSVPEIESAIVASGALPTLAALLRSSTLADVHEHVALALCNVAQTDVTKRAIVRLDVLEPLRALRMADQNSSARAQACRRALETLGNVLTPASRRALRVERAAWPGTASLRRRGSSLSVPRHEERRESE